MCQHHSSAAYTSCSRFDKWLYHMYKYFIYLFISSARCLMEIRQLLYELLIRWILE